MSFSVIASGLLFALKNWRLILSLWTFPPLPKNWQDSSDVRRFFVALLKSQALIEIFTRMPSKWSGSRLKLIDFASNVILWDAAWAIAFRTDGGNDGGGERRLTLRERIRNRISGTTAKEFVTEEQVEGTEELAKKIKALLLTFDEATF